jgi:hypothetical protein
MITPASTKAAIRELLFAHYEFADCILTRVVWERFGSVVNLEFNYLYSDAEGFYLDSTGQPMMKQPHRRGDLNAPVLKTLQCQAVQEFHIHNHLNDSQLTDLGAIDWGFSEVQSFRIQEDSLFLSKYRNRALPFHHVVIAFSGDRRIDLVFNAIQVV